MPNTRISRQKRAEREKASVIADVPVENLAEKSAAAPASGTPPKDSGKGRVFLIDAMSFIFRAYHAMSRQRPMSTRTGVPTAATYVFVNMLRKLRADFSPEHIAAVYDVAAPTFRDEQAKQITSIKKFDSATQTYVAHPYGGYKANRAEMPQDLAQQLPYIRRALNAYCIPILEHAGFEADDVIGTLARKAAAESYPVYVVSSDKDMLQLVNDKVCVLNPPKDNLICDAAKVEELLGVRPQQVVDVMALRGDSIDNIPGAPGIGDKGSVELIKRFGTVDNLLAHAGEVEKKSYRESLEHNREVVLASRELARIDTNVQVEFDPGSMTANDPDVEALRQLFTELEFTTLLKELVGEVKLTEGDYREADSKSAADVEAVLKHVSKKQPLAFALEATTAASMTKDEEEEVENESGTLPLVPVSLAAVQEPSRKAAISAQQGVVLSLPLDDDAAANALKKALADPKLPKAVHDYKSAMRRLGPRGIALAGVEHDPMLYSYLLDPTYTAHGLKEIAIRRFNLNVSGTVAEAADLTHRFASRLRDDVEKENLTGVYDTIDLPLVPVLARMEEAGVKIDCDVLARMSTRLEREAEAKAGEVYAASGQPDKFNINSPKQLGDVLFNKMALPKPVKYGKGKTISTAQDVMESLAGEHPIARMVLDYRQLTKLKSTYVDALPLLCHPATGRLHTTFNQAATATGRLSSTNPNLQNIPIRSELGKEIRAAFTAEPGHVLLAADYSQIELRLLAHFSEDPLLIAAFQRGEDIHTLTASQVFGVPPMMMDPEHRRRAKAVNFGIVYGLSAFGLSQQLGIEQKEAKQFIEAYFAKYQGVRKFIDATLDAARREQKVRTLFGRTRPIPDIHSKNPTMRGFAERTAVNTPLQGTAADLIKLAMIRIDEELRRQKLKSRMTLQVHDELVFEVPNDEVDTMRALVRARMEHVHPLRVPLDVDLGVGPNWRDLNFDD
ncbi:MAG: DNA polymerase I [Candidatus Koribacter versatilis]|uniref:DNA polymerase I n=1 Tax=Candidatus Korobacter versatilis TaxID=658062 RepID=A0A932AA89_9BACT|nr:DNA polymerase I [Candidatus Koribacter versatilis]